MKEKPGKGGESYSPDDLKNVHTQLSCIFNHAIKYYGLQIDPAAKAGNMGSEQPKEILYWCGIRESELLALPPRTQPEGRRLFPHRRAPSGCPVCAGSRWGAISVENPTVQPFFDRSNTVFKFK